jgi:hypothetical protein
VKPVLATLAAVFALAETPALAINKCVGKDGKVTYQEDKCPDDAKKGTLKALPSSPGMLSPEEDKEDATLNTLVWVMSSIERCSQASPAYARNAAKGYEEYRREHAQSIARIERSPRYREMLRENRARTAEIMRNPAQRQEAAETCGDGK